MKLGFNTNGLQNHRLDDALRLLAEHGYEHVALTLDTMHLDPFRAGRAEIDGVASLLRELSLSVSIETGARYLLDPRHKHEPTLMTRDERARGRRLEFYERAAAIGATLGARVLALWSGVDRNPGPDSWSWLGDGLREACAIVRRHGLEPALEPEPGMAVATFADFRRVVAALGAQAPSLCLDVGHLHVLDEGEPAAIVAQAGPFLAMVQLEDIRKGVHEHLPPGEGDVDFPAILGALRTTGYQGPVCFELSRSSHRAPEVVATCRRVFLGR